MDTWFVIMARLGWCSVLLVVSAGCWQEVHYDPDKPVITPVVSDHPEATNDTKVDNSTSDTSPAADQIPDEVTAGELFGAPEVAAPTEDLVPDTDAPDDSSKQPREEPDLETPETPGSISDQEVESPIATSGMEPSTSEESPPAESVVETDRTGASSEIMRPSKMALAVWRMSSRWSFAAAIYAKGQPEESYRDFLEQATYAAELVGVELPTFPATEGMALEATVIGYLLDTGPAGFVNKLSEDYIPEYEALAELAIRTNALLLVYTPKSQQLDTLISSIRQSAERSGLPAELWTDLVAMLERREPFADVKERVLRFHTEVGDYLTGE